MRVLRHFHDILIVYKEKLHSKLLQMQKIYLAYNRLSISPLILLQKSSYDV